MENASKALIFAASVLIGIMLLSLMVYTFKSYNSTAKETEKRLSQREIAEINAKFLDYDTGSHNLDDIFTITYVRQNLTGDTQSKTFKYKELFGTYSNPNRNITNDDYYRKSLIVASQDLNTVSDVVSAINDAIDTNCRNSNNYLYNEVEIQNSVEIIVDLGEQEYKDLNFNKPSGAAPNQFRYLIIEPSRNVKAKHIYGFNRIVGGKDVIDGMDKETRANTLTFEDNNAIKTYDMLEELRDTKIIQDELKSYTVHKYYFFGEIHTNDRTGLIDSVKFTLINDYDF